MFPLSHLFRMTMTGLCRNEIIFIFIHSLIGNEEKNVVLQYLNILINSRATSYGILIFIILILLLTSVTPVRSICLTWDPQETPVTCCRLTLNNRIQHGGCLHSCFLPFWHGSSVFNVKYRFGWALWENLPRDPHNQDLPLDNGSISEVGIMVQKPWYTGFPEEGAVLTFIKATSSCDESVKK